MFKIINKIRTYRKNKYINNLTKKGFNLGKDVYIGDGSFLDPSHCFLITIGDNSVLSNSVKMIAHDASMFQHLGITRIGKILVGKNCFLGNSVIVLPGVSIGDNSIIGAGSIVSKDIPPNSVASGVPAKVICSLDVYLQKHKANMKKYRTFSEKRYNLACISNNDKFEMVQYLSNNGLGYMEGTIPDYAQ